MNKFKNISIIILALIALGFASCDKYEPLTQAEDGSEQTLRGGDIDINDDSNDGINDGDDDDDEESAKRGSKDGVDDPDSGVNDGDEDEDEAAAKSTK